MALSGLWEISREAVYSGHEGQPSGLNIQPNILDTSNVLFCELHSTVDATF